MASGLRRGGAQGRDGQKDSALRLMARRTHVRRRVGVHGGGTSGQDRAQRWDAPVAGQQMTRQGLERTRVSPRVVQGSSLPVWDTARSATRVLGRW
jgi:hypothetical protein